MFAAIRLAPVLTYVLEKNCVLTFTTPLVIFLVGIGSVSAMH